MSLFVNLQSLSCINSGAAHAIPVFYLVDGHAVFACDGRQGFSAAYFVIGYFSLWGTFPLLLRAMLRVFATDTVRRFLNSSALRWA